MSAESQLRREIRQSRPFRSVYHEGTISLLRTADMVRSRFERLLAPHGVTLQQYNVLRILRGARPGALPTMEIAVRMIESAPGITRLLDRLEAKGLVVRKRCAEDRRRVLCSISDEAMELLSGLDDPVDEEDRQALDALEEDEVREMVGLLARVRLAQM